MFTLFFMSTLIQKRRQDKVTKTTTSISKYSLSSNKNEMLSEFKLQSISLNGCANLRGLQIMGSKLDGQVNRLDDKKCQREPLLNHNLSERIITS